MVQPIQAVERRSAVAFGHRGVVKDVVDEVFHRSAIGQDRLADMDQFGSPGSDDMDAQEGMCLTVKNDF